MPTPGAAVRLTRRHVALAGLAGAATLTSGCTDDRSGPGPLPPGPNPDEELVVHALRLERSMVRRLEATGRRHASLRRRLRQPLVVHRAHVGLLSRAVEGGSTRPGQPSERGPRPPATAKDALVALARAEQTLRDDQVASATRARSGDLARVLAGMAAAAAQQASVLGAGS
jgi:hypothetical protein